MVQVYKPNNQGNPTFVAPAINPTKEDFMTILIKYGTRIVGGQTNGIDNGFGIMYTCPRGKVFFIVAATLSTSTTSSQNRAAMTLQSAVLEPLSSYGFIQIHAPITSGIPSFTSVALCPTIPIIVNEGEMVSIYNQSNPGFTTGSVVGYEIDKSMYERII